MEQVPLFKHGFEKHGLVSVSQKAPVEYSSQAHLYLKSTWSWRHWPLLEQFSQHPFRSWSSNLSKLINRFKLLKSNLNEPIEGLVGLVAKAVVLVLAKVEVVLV